MMQGETKVDQQSHCIGTERATIVFVSASVEDACALWEQVEDRGWAVVNVPDLKGARAVIEKVSPALVVCDTDIEGPGSWRDLLDWQVAKAGYELMVASRHSDVSLWTEVLLLGGSKVVEKPLVASQFESAMRQE